jgi:hyperosmotically inducible protein
VSRLTSLLLTVAFVSPAFAQADRDREHQIIIKEVRHELVMLPRISVFDNISYSLSGYTVTLSGQVTQPYKKDDAGNAVKGIEGVQKIDNRIEVLPLSPNDDRLRQRLYQAIYGFTTLNKYALPVIKPIRIIVKNGHVALEGVVDNQSDKNVAGIRANGVSGVFSVENNLQVAK